MTSPLLENYNRVKSELAAVAAEAGRDPAEVELLPVSKTFPVADIAELFAAGCRIFGENRTEELLRKAAALPPEIQWHFIGRLQANKVRKVLGAAAVIHSVDSLSLLQRIDRIAGELGRQPEILLEVNVSGEASKAGVAPAELRELAKTAVGLENLRLAGLMTMAPQEAEPAELDRIFGGLKKLRQELETALRRPLPVLSMGMSGDYPAAVRHGATLVRIGGAIFGTRNHDA